MDFMKNKMIPKKLNLGGKEFVIIDRKEYENLIKVRSERHNAAASGPELPRPDHRGLRPARETLRAILARDIIRDRVAQGLSQGELARRAGIRAETLCRIEQGRHTPTIATIEKIDRVLSLDSAKISGRKAS
jgi:ribosome-binding protein aMBF1 (putative translation factor)